MMKRILLALALAATPVAAQETEEERDRGFIVGLIEDNLSAPGLQVRLDGFEGALSSEASLEVLTVSDDDGPWLRLEDVVLDWNRSALLRGRLEVEALTAGLIRVDRAPLPAEGVEALPDAGAGGFSLPNLPVSVDVEVIRADRIELGAPLLGQELAMTLEASAALADGSGRVSLLGQRLDGVEGVFEIDAAYDAGTTELAVDVAIEEAEGGIAATLLQLPGAPAIALTVQGQGPLDDFSARVAVASDGVDRLAGDVTLTGVEDGRRFEVDIGGDVTALLAPRYQPFFGEDVRVQVAGVARDDGGTELETLSVDTQALTLEGRATIGADGWPTLLDVEGQLAAEDGGPVLLPTETAISVGGGSFLLSLDANVSDEWRLVLSVDEVRHPELTASVLQLSASGEVLRAEGTVTGATGQLAVGAGDLAFVDPSLQDAVGSDATLSARIDWEQGAPIRIEGLELSGPALTASGDISYDAGAELPIGLDLTAQVADLSRVAGLAGLEALDGAAELTLNGAVAPGGAFDLDVSGGADDLVTGIAQADALLDGRTALALEARRDASGTFVDALDLSNPQVSVIGSGAIYAEDAPEREDGRASQATLAVVLADGSVIDPRLAGRTRATAVVSQNVEGAWTGTATVNAPQDVELRAEGVLTGPQADVQFTASVPDLSAFVEGIPGGVSANGRAFVDPDGLWRIDAAAEGPWALTAEVEGRVTGERPELAYTARLPDPTGPVPALESIPALAAPVELSGTLVQEGGAWVTETRIDGPEGVVIRAEGPVTGPGPRLDITATVPELQAFVPQVEGTLSLDATVAREGEDWRVDARAAGPDGLRATVETVATDTPLAVDFTLLVPDLSDYVAAVPGGLDLSGVAVQAPEGWQVDVTGTGPYDARLEVQARLPEAGPEVDASIVVPDASEIAGVLEGELTVDARARQRDGVWSAEVDAAGPYDATLTATARLPEDGAQIEADLRLPDVGALDPRLEGPLTVDVDARQVDGVWEAELDAAGPLDATVTASARLPEDGARVVADVRIPDSRVLAERLEGPLTVDLDARQDDGVWTAEFDAAGPLDATATGTARIGAEDAVVDFALRVPDSSVLAPQLNGPLQADVTARQVDGAWTADLDADGPFDARTVGTVRTEGGVITADLDVTVPDLARVSPQLEGTLELALDARQEDGVWTADLDAAGPFDATATGSARVDGGDVEADLDLTVPDTAAIAPQLSGPLTASVQANQSDGVLTVDLDATGPFDARTTGTARLEDGDITADLQLDVPDASAIVPALSGSVSAEVDARQRDGVWTVDLDAAGPFDARTTGTARLDGGDVTANLDLRVPDAAAISPALSGPIEAEVQADQSDGVWDIALDATGPFDARTEGTVRLDGEDIAADLDLRVPDASRIVPQMRGAIVADVEAQRTDGVWTADLDVDGPSGARTTGTVELAGNGDIVADLDLDVPDSAEILPQLNGPIRAQVDARQSDGAWTADLDVTGPFGARTTGRVGLEGGDTTADLDLNVPDTSRISPRLRGPLTAEVDARQTDGIWNVTADASGPFGGTATATARLAGAEADVDANLRLPNSAVLAPQLSGPLVADISATQRDGVWRADIDANGPLGGTFDVAGVVAGGPVDVDVDLSIPDISPIVPDLPGPLRVTGGVSQQGEAYAVDLDVSGPSGTQADVAGTIQTDGGLGLSVAGTAPLGLANPFIAPRRISGTGRFDLRLNGPPSLESVTGTISTQGAALALPTLNNDLDPIDATIRLTGGQAVIDLTGRLGSGGVLSVEGPVGLSAPFVADLRVGFDGTVEDPNLYTAQVRAAVAVTGPLTGGGTISGRVVIPEAEIQVPSTGLTSIGELPPIDHLSTPRPVQRTLARAGQDAASLAEANGSGGGAAGPGFTLDLVVSAPGRIFVRGRGLDAELGGELRLSGTTATPITAGGFELIRGRLDVLQQRFELDEGSITFQGDLVPYIRLVAVTQAENLTASIVVEGPADAIEVSFESDPPAPEEEILAQIFFGRDLGELSPIQALQLANSVAVLAGRSSGGLLQRLRGSTGLDDLDVITDSDGNTAVRAGKYISDNVYTTVEVDQTGDASVSLNLDLTPNLTIRGTTGAQGESSLGIFFEKDY